MLLVLYVAVALALSMPAIRSRGPERDLLVPITLVCVPIALAGLSWFILRPGPRRDWVMGFFLCLSLTLNTFWWTVDYFTGTSELEWFIRFAMIMQFGLGGIWLAKRSLILERCPRCGKMALLNADP